MINPTSVPPNEEAKLYAHRAVDASFDPAEGSYVSWVIVESMLAIAWQTGYQTALEPYYCQDGRICWNHRHA